MRDEPFIKRRKEKQWIKQQAKYAENPSVSLPICWPSYQPARHPASRWKEETREIINGKRKKGNGWIGRPSTKDLGHRGARHRNSLHRTLSLPILIFLSFPPISMNHWRLFSPPTFNWIRFYGALLEWTKRLWITSWVSFQLYAISLRKGLSLF